MAAALLLAGCATPYQKFNFLGGGGFQDKELEPDVYRVNFSANGYTSEDRVQICTVYRCAELTVEKGGDWFAFLTARSQDANPLTQGRAVISVPSGGFDLPKFAGTAIFRVFKGEKPADYADALNAREVMEKLKPRVFKEDKRSKR